MRRTVLCFGVCVASLLCQASQFTPLSWQQRVVRHSNPALVGQRKNITWSRDLNRNFIEDSIEHRFRPTDRINIVVDLNRCVPPNQLRETLGRYGQVNYIGKMITFVLMNNVLVSDIPAIAARPEVAMVELQRKTKEEIDVSSKAVQAHKSVEYAGLSAEDQNLDGTGIVIAILGTGVTQADWVQLAGKYVAGYNASDPNDPGDGSTNPVDRVTPPSYHETEMAVIAVGAAASGHNCRPAGTGNAGGCAGIASGAKYVNVRYDCTTNPTTQQTSCDTLKAIDWIGVNAKKFNIRIVNMAFTSCPDSGSGDDDGTDATAVAANYLAGIGLVVVASGPSSGCPVGSGNPGDKIVKSPGSGSFVIDVNGFNDHGTVTRNDDTVTSYFRTGPRVDFNLSDINLLALKPDIAAPGEGLTLYQKGTTVYSPVSGTSPASAIVSGAAALVLQKYPAMQPDSMKQLLTSNADTQHNTPYNSATGAWDTGLGWGELNVGAALNAARTNSTDVTFPGCGTGTPVGQPCNLSNGAPFWDNEQDITSMAPPREGVMNTVTVQVKNAGTHDGTVQVNFGTYVFAAGNSQFYHLGTKQVTIQAGQTIPVSIDWTPQQSDHQCIQVSIAYGLDSDYSNNVTQRNFQVAASTYKVRVENPFFVPAEMQVVAKSQKPGWVCKANKTNFKLDPFTDCPQEVEVTFNPPPGTPIGAAAKCQVAVFATPEKGERKLVGGVTVQTYVPRPCQLYGQVVDTKGKPVTKASVRFASSEADHKLPPAIATTDETGTFSVRITPDVSQTFSVTAASGKGTLVIRPQCGPSLPRVVLGKDSLKLEYLPPEMIDVARK